MSEKNVASVLPQEKTAPHGNGFIALIANIVGMLAALACIVFGVIRLAHEFFLIGGVLLTVGVICLVALCILLASYKVVAPNQALVLTLFGKYYGTLRTPGFYAVNPFVTANAPAVMNGEPIEKRVKGTKHGRDVCGGFEDGWIEMLELNSNFAEPGMQEALDRTVEALRKGRLSVFKGDYIGVNLANASDSVNLKDGFTENAQSSFPSFHYILDGVVAIGE